MELQIQNKWISIHGHSYVKDMEGKEVMKVRGKFWTFTKKKYIEDLEGNVHYVVRNKFWKLIAYSAFIMDKDENKLCKVRRKVFSLHDHYDIPTDKGKITIRGNILGFDYKILLNDKEIGHVARKISLRDSFVLTLDDDQDAMFFVALVIAIDNITDERNESAAAAGHSYSSGSN